MYVGFVSFFVLAFGCLWGLIIAVVQPMKHSVKRWLDSAQIRHSVVHEFSDISASPIIAIYGTGTSIEPEALLHLLATPMTDSGISTGHITPRVPRLLTHASTIPVVHLHEDIWNTQGDIVRSRLLAKLGRYADGGRHFARKTYVRRIHALDCMAFLEKHHLWGATKAKHNYGLFVSGTQYTGSTGSNRDLVAQEGLLAVASFSPRRHVMRSGTKFRSHELIRYCARRDGTVVGGISKLIAAFAKDYNPDDIITTIDRDFGSAEGWKSLGFEVVQQHPPRAMAVSLDGTRHALFGSGLIDPDLISRTNVCRTGAGSSLGGQPAGNKSANRWHLPAQVREALSLISSAREARTYLSVHGYACVYDCGVTRLMKTLPGAQALQQLSANSSRDPVALWKESVPTFPLEYYCENSGIRALLREAADSASSM